MICWFVYTNNAIVCLYKHMYTPPNYIKYKVYQYMTHRIGYPSISSKNNIINREQKNRITSLHFKCPFRIVPNPLLNNS